MGLYDRDYTNTNFQSQFRHVPQMRMTFPQMTPMVKRLLIINVAVFFLQILGAGNFLRQWFSVNPASLLSVLQFWRLITYQFLHGSIMHILFNMLGLFFLGPILERHWGSRRFLIFYLSCGAVGGVFYTLLATIGFLPALEMVGASGAILGMLAACAILFPQFVVFFFFFPIPIRIATVALTAIYLAAVITKSANAGGDAAHLAGMAAGAFYVYSQGWQTKFKSKIDSRLWEKKAAARRDLQVELDRILQKVHESGIHSLTRKERNILKQATEAEQRRGGL